MIHLYFFFSTIFLCSSVIIQASGIIFENSNSSDSDSNEFYSQSDYEYEPESTSLSTGKKRKAVIEILQKSDLITIEENNKNLERIINHATGYKLLKNTTDLTAIIDEFSQKNFNVFRAIFVVPNQDNILEDLHRILITRIAADRLTEIAKKLKQSDFLLQIWIFTRLMDVYMEQLYEQKDDIHEDEDKKNLLRVTIVTLGKQINKMQTLYKKNQSSKSVGIDYVGLVFKAVNMINYLPNATKKSKSLTNLIHDIKVRIDQYYSQIAEKADVKNSSFVNKILKGYLNYAQHQYARKFHILQSEIFSLFTDITKQKKYLFSKRNILFVALAIFTGVTMNRVCAKGQRLLQKFVKKIMVETT